MSDRCIVMFAIGLTSPAVRGRNIHYADYTRIAWKKYCDKHGIDFKFVEQQHPDSCIDVAHPKWHTYTVFDYVDENHTKIGIVESDTMPNFNAPDFFKAYTDEFCGVVDNESIRWLADDLSDYNRRFPDLDFNLDIGRYLNSGVLLFTRDHMSLFRGIQEVYVRNKDRIDGDLKSQTLLNFVLKSTKLKLLDIRHNTMGLNHNGWFSYNWQRNGDTTPFLLKYSHVWHFTDHHGLKDPSEKYKLIKSTWDNLSSFYE
jgi:hypothetical protein